MGQIEINHTGSGGGVVLSSDGTDLLLGGSAIGGGGASAYTIENKTSAYTLVAGDLGKIITVTSSSDVTLSVTAAATLGAGWFVYIRNLGTSAGGEAIIDPNSSETINGQSTWRLERSEIIKVVCDGSNFFTYFETNPRVRIGTVSSNGATVVPTGAYSGVKAGAIAIGDGASTDEDYAVAIGPNATARGIKAVAIGTFNASATYGAHGTASFAMGQNAKASSDYSIALGHYSLATNAGAIALGNYNQAVSDYSMVIGGRWGKTTVKGQRAYPCAVPFNYSYYGHNQGCQYSLMSDTTDATAEAMTTNNATAAADNQIVAASDTCIMFSGTIVAMQNGAADQGGWEIKGLLKNDGGTTTLVNSEVRTLADGNGWSIVLSADNTNNALKVQCTGEAAHNIRWVANIQTSEVTYA